MDEEDGGESETTMAMVPREKREETRLLAMPREVIALERAGWRKGGRKREAEKERSERKGAEREGRSEEMRRRQQQQRRRVQTRSGHGTRELLDSAPFARSVDRTKLYHLCHAAMAVVIPTPCRALAMANESERAVAPPLSPATVHNLLYHCAADSGRVRYDFSARRGGAWSNVPVDTRPMMSD